MLKTRLVAALAVLFGAGLGNTISAWAQNPTANVSVNVSANRRAIDPRIYGIAYGTSAQLSDLNVPLNRMGGNNTTRYNWQLNADNRGFDWYFQSIAEASSTPGGRGNTFMSDTQAGGARPMITIPMIDWVARLGTNRGKLASFSQAKYGAQTDADWQWMPDAGNGILASNGQYVVGNDPNDANTPNNSNLQLNWVQNIVSTWGAASAAAPRYYLLDNEPSIWHSSHRDVHPTGASMDEMKAKILDYAAQIRAADPQGVIVGPEEWGWSGYTLSGYDQQWGGLHGWSNLPDRAAHGTMDYLPWLLQQMKNDGRHLLDVFTVHYYPQGGEFSNDTSNSMQLLRNKSTRSLWDPTYMDQSWINDKVQLIPRLRSWADTYYYPGTPIGITEYNWGAENHINGATAQADILGIFGREGLTIAARWTTPAATTHAYKAMKMYRNYDGNKSAFGDVSVAASGPNPDNVAVFAAQRTSDGALTIMVISKYLSGSTPVSIALANFGANGSAQVYQLTSANVISRLADLSFTNSTVNFTAPAQSVNLLVLPTGGTPNTPPTAVAGGTPTSGVAPLTVNFNSTGSNDADGSIASYSWNFGDGTPAGSGPVPSHVYASAGNFIAVLTVTDNGGTTATASVGITVSAAPTVPNAPSSLIAKGAKGKATLSWVDNSSNENGFYVERAPSGSTNFVRVGTVGANVRTFIDTLAKGNYVYRVQAYNAVGASAYSNTASASVK
jgi:PKD repeat protein